MKCDICGAEVIDICLSSACLDMEVNAMLYTASAERLEAAINSPIFNDPLDSLADAPAGRVTVGWRRAFRQIVMSGAVRRNSRRNDKRAAHRAARRAFTSAARSLHTFKVNAIRTERHVS